MNENARASRNGEMRSPVRVWDAPVRLFHWGIVALVFTAWLTQREDWMLAHFICGYTIFAALLFRLIWGFVGSDTARFSRLLRSPIAAAVHLAHLHRREPDDEIGHNAAGGWMVLLMLLLLAVEVGTGLCTTTEADMQGPWAPLMRPSLSGWLTYVHVLNFTFIEVAVALHVAAVLVYAVLKRHNLVRPMISGHKHLPPSCSPPRMRSSVLAAAIFVAAGGLVAFVVTYF